MDEQQGQPGSGPTGDAAVDTQLEALKALESLPVQEHQAVYADLHDGLRRALDGDSTEA